MKINNVSQLFQEKITEVNSRLPKDTNIKSKFDAILEQSQLKSQNENPSKDNSLNTETNSNPTTLLKNMIATNSYLSSTSNLFSSDSTSNNLFPASTLNNSINTLNQNLLLKSLNNIEKNSSGTTDN